MFEKGHVDSSYFRVNAEELHRFVLEVMKALGVSEEDARIVADNLVMADLRGIESHGVQRLKRYVDGILSGGINLKAKGKILREGPSYALIDGEEGLGQVIGHKGMKIAIKKAKETGIGLCLVRNSNHYGIAGYYALMAAKEGMVGISMTNSRPLVAPTWGTERILGTNPISLGAPMKEGYFLLDMATSVVPMGKIEVLRRKGKKAPDGWGINSEGGIERSPEEIMRNGALLPLGGFGEILGGHKGYGLSLMVDILSGLLSGGTWSKYVKNTSEKGSNVCHFFLAIDIEHFLPLEEFKERMSQMASEIKGSKAVPGRRIWIHGEKGFLTEETRRKIGIPIYEKVYYELREIAEKLGVRPVEGERVRE